MEIRGFIENSLLEWEGNISCVVFVPGCNLRCPFCHAGHLIKPSCLESIPEEQILRYMDRQSDWLDGAVITGGEPTLHEQELVDFTEKVRDIGLDVMVETNGTRPKWVKRLISAGYVQALAMDVKAPLKEDPYRTVAGKDVDVQNIRSSMQAIMESEMPYEFRITVVPGLVGREEVSRMAPDLEGARMIAVQNFQPDNCLDTSLRGKLPYRPEEMDAIAEELSGTGARVVMRGRDRGLIARSNRRAG